MSQGTISDEYLRHQQALHQNPDYGTASLMFAPLVAQLVRQYGVKSISDYGAGKRRLLEGLRSQGIVPAEYFPYDPVFPEYGPPRPADLVCCIDVLEHIEPEFIDGVFADLTSITKGIGFFTVHMGPAIKVLTDGRNAHLIQQPSSWWLQKLTKTFDVLQLQTINATGVGFCVLVKPAGTPVPEQAYAPPQTQQKSYSGGYR